MRRLAGLALLLGIFAGCRPNTVSVSFRPAAGSTYSYEVRVRSASTTTIEGQSPTERVEEVRLVAEHTVLDAGDDGVRVRVLVGEPGTTAQAFVVRFDRGAELESIESVEGGAEEIVGALGVSEIFPGVAGAPPGRELAPGERWSAVRHIDVPGTSERSRARTTGRLVELGVVRDQFQDRDESIVRLESTTVLPLTDLITPGGGLLVRAGRQRIEQVATYDLDDGAVRRAEATTTGTFDIEVQPPLGTGAPALPGTLEVRVTSTTRRLG